MELIGTLEQNARSGQAGRVHTIEKPAYGAVHGRTELWLLADQSHVALAPNASDGDVWTGRSDALGQRPPRLALGLVEARPERAVGIGLAVAQRVP